MQLLYVDANYVIISLICCLGDILNPDSLSFLIEPRFHGALSGLFTRAIVLLQLCKECDSLRPLLDPLSSSKNLQDIHRQFVLNGLFLPQVFIDALNTDESRPVTDQACIIAVTGSSSSNWVETIGKEEYQSFVVEQQLCECSTSKSETAERCHCFLMGGDFWSRAHCKRGQTDWGVTRTQHACLYF